MSRRLVWSVVLLLVLGACGWCQLPALPRPFLPLGGPQQGAPLSSPHARAAAALPARASAPPVVIRTAGTGSPPELFVGVAGPGVEPSSPAEALAVTQPVLPGTVPQFAFSADGPGYVYAQSSLFIINLGGKNWHMTAAGVPLLRQGGAGSIPLTRVEVRDAKEPTPWMALSANPSFNNEKHLPWVQLQFRIKVEAADALGTYVGQCLLHWWYPTDHQGTIVLELDLNVPQALNISIDGEGLDFGSSAGNKYGWIYSNESTLHIISNFAFDIAIASGDDLKGPSDRRIDTALRLRNLSDGDPWITWGDLGGDAHDGGADPWAGTPDTGSPWPGAVGQAAPLAGENRIGLTAAARRSDVRDPAGSYHTTITITVAPR